MAGIGNAFNTLQGNFNTLSGSLNSSINTLTNNLSTATGDIASLSGTLTTTNTNLSNLTTNFNTLSGNVTTLSGIVANKINLTSLSVTGELLSYDNSTGVFGFTGTTTNITEGTNLYFTNARSIASQLTGFAAASGTIVATDTIVQAFQKLQGSNTLQDNSITSLLTNLSTATGDIASLFTSLATTNTNLSTATGNIASLSGTLTTTNTNLSNLTTNFNTLSGNVTTLSGIVATKINLTNLSAS